MDKSRTLNYIGIIRYQLEKLEENINTKSDWYLDNGYDEEKVERTLEATINNLAAI